MRLSTLLDLLLSMTVFAVYFYAIDPLLLNNRWLALLVFILIASLLGYFNGKVKNHFEFLSKRIDKQLSLWIVFSLFVIPFLLISMN